MRDTSYAKEIASASIAFDEANEGKIEKIFVKETSQEEIRFSWWKDRRMIPRPLDLSENDLIELLKNAIEADVFSSEFRSKVRSLF
jgi:hypothetical protein